MTSLPGFARQALLVLRAWDLQVGQWVGWMEFYGVFQGFCTECACFILFLNYICWSFEAAQIVAFSEKCCIWSIKEFFDVFCL